ncbi:MAG: DUF6282 family protein [Vicinamibacterales bacterium]
MRDLRGLSARYGRRLLLMAAIAAAAIGGLGRLTVADAAGGQTAGEADARRVLRGAIEIHLHVDPLSYGADIGTLRVARERGVRAVVVKNHFEPTVDLALLLGKELPGLEVFGGIDLNWIVGGLNLAIVEHMARTVGGRGGIVWMTTLDSEQAVRTAKWNRPFIVVSRGGDLVPEVEQIISVLAEHDLVLATGHVSPAEGLMMLREGQRQGVAHMVVTHAMDNPVFMSVPQMQEAADLGAFIEFDFRYVLVSDGQVEAIRTVGPEHVILSEFWTNSDPLEYAGLSGVADFVEGMRRQGFTDPELDLMFKENPARLLGLSAN